MKQFANFILTSLIFFTTIRVTAQTHEWTLQECTNYAVENNISIKQTEQSIQSQEIRLNSAQNTYLPDVSASASQNFSFGRGLTANNTYSNTNTRTTSFSVGANMNLFNGFQRKNNIELNKLNLNAMNVDLEKVKNDVRLQVAQAYVQILYDMEIEDVTRRQIEIDSEQVARLVSFVINGKSSEAELSQQKASLANSKLTYTQAVNNRKLSILTLSQLLELPSPDSFAIVRPDTSQLVFSNFQSSNINYEERPEIKAEQIRLNATEYSYKVARSGYLPTLSISGGLSTNYYTVSNMPSESFSKQIDNNFSQYIGINLNIPIFSRFNVRNDVRDVKIQRENQQLSLDLARKNLYKEIQQVNLNAENALAKVISSREAVSNSEIAFRLAKARYENGKSTITEFNEAKNNYLKSQSDYAQTIYEFMYCKMLVKWYSGEEMAW
ncbi:MAG: TolC family protein [Bacteroidales bacterium]|nr:TolC family protein [Bacteroidales bacterium]